MGKIVSVKPGYTAVSLPSGNFNQNESTTLTDAEYAGLTAPTLAAITVINASVTDPVRNSSYPVSLYDALTQAKAYTDAHGGGGAVSSVAGRTGAVTLATSDISGLSTTLAAKADLVSGTVPLSQIPVFNTPVTLFGSGVPVNNVTGLDGDYYKDIATGNIYGPRVSGAWGSVIVTDLQASIAGVSSLISAAFGDGSDGAAVLDGTATVAWASKSGSNYTMTRDALPSSLTINSGVQLRTSNYRIWCNGTVTINSGGILRNSGFDAAGVTGGTGQASTALFGSANGASGGTGVGTAGQSQAARAAGGAGGAGGAGTSGAGGAAGTATIPTGPEGGLAQLRTMPCMFTGSSIGQDSARGIHPGATGGTGAGDGTNAGGGAGGGAGVLLVVAGRLINNGSIQCNGGAGGTPPTGNCGGGGGAGGGVIILTTTSYTGSGTITATGGAGGSGIGTGTAGAAGASGTAVTNIIRS